MTRLFAIYCAAILGFFIVATEDGFAVESLFGTHFQGKPGEPGYQRPSAVYHK